MNRDPQHIGALTSNQIAVLLRPYLAENTVAGELYDQLAQYLELLLRWNARTNLTAIRKQEEIVTRHFGESLFAAQHLGVCETLLDFGSGAGFPGLPIQLLHPELKVTLAESQNKKATFLREVVRTLALPTEVWAARVETLQPGRTFDVVTLRAVDEMNAALQVASSRARSKLVLLSTGTQTLEVPDHFELEANIAVVQSNNQRILILRRTTPR